MSTIVEQSTEINAPVSTVFAYVDDFSNTPDWMYGLSRIEPVTEQRRGVGATYEGSMKVGISLDSTIRCIDYEVDRLIEIESIKGIKNRQRWTFTALADDRTRVDAWISFELPGGFAGTAAERIVKPLIGVAVAHTTRALVSNVEAL
jgi:uncharacterized membrane protein